MRLQGLYVITDNQLTPTHQLLDKVERLLGLDIGRFAGIVTGGIHGLSVLILVKLASPSQSA